MRKFSGILVFSSMALSFAGCGVVESVLLRPSHTTRMTPTDFGYTYEVKTINMDDGTPLAVWHVKTSVSPRKGIIVVVPGNDSNKSRYVIGLPLFVDDGWDMILMDYPGYGESGGTPTFAGMIAGTGKVVDYAKTQSDVVVGYGVSLGTIVLIRVAADHDFTAVMFDGTVNLFEEVGLFSQKANIWTPIAPAVDLFTTTTVTPDLDAKRWIAQVTEPKLFLHSPDDTITPLAGAMGIYDAAPQPKNLFLTQGDHALALFLDPGLYRAVVNGWLNGVINQDPILNAQFQVLLQGEIRESLEELGFPPTAKSKS